MAKIGVYVPDERMKDIERWRDKINFSRVFMEAFDRAIVAETTLTSVKGKDMKALIARLKKETNGTFEHAWKLGAKEGREWALNHANYGHLRQIGEGEMSFDKPDSNVMGLLYGRYEAHYFRTEEDQQAEMELERFGDAETYRRGFNRGFVDAVKQVWDEIKTAI
jgi:hypothetical protein